MITLPSSASTGELYESASNEFGGLPVVSLRGGFPPRAIPCDESTPISSLLSNQERVQVEFAAVAATDGGGGGSATRAAPSSSPSAAAAHPLLQPLQVEQAPTMTTGGGRKSKRAASRAATESMPALIQAQEASSLRGASPGKKRARTAAAAGSRSGGGGGGSNRNATPTKPKPVVLPATAGVTGRRLADGATVTTSVRRAATAAGRRRAASAAAAGAGGRTGPAVSAATDMSEALLGALHDGGQMGVILRRGMKNAVRESYETTRAFSRLASIQARSFRISEPSAGAANAGGDSISGGANAGGGLLTVVYHGTVDKARVEEVVDCIPQDVLRAVMEGIYASDVEALRPENLARLSPRVLWSCVYHHPDASDVSEMYRRLLPHLDWTFLRRRAMHLSEKALENQRQAEEAEEMKRGGGGGRMDLERASEAVAAVEHAMEHLQDYQAEERKARQARLAQQQQGHLREGDGARPWCLTTPSDPDRDELRQCIESSLPPTSMSSTGVSDMALWITKMMKECRIHNWRELANVTDHAAIAIKLQVEEAHVQAWIDHAQDESVSEIMVEVCDGLVEAVEILTERARSGTPKDLAGWRAIPELLLDQVRRQQGPVHEATSSKGATTTDGNNNNNKNNDHGTTTPHDWMNLTTIALWCDRAHRVVQDYEWLHWYATPLE